MGCDEGSKSFSWLWVSSSPVLVIEKAIPFSIYVLVLLSKIIKLLCPFLVKSDFFVRQARLGVIGATVIFKPHRWQQGILSLKYGGIMGQLWPCSMWSLHQAPAARAAFIWNPQSVAEGQGANSGLTSTIPTLTLLVNVSHGAKPVGSQGGKLVLSQGRGHCKRQQAV